MGKTYTLHVCTCSGRNAGGRARSGRNNEGGPAWSRRENSLLRRGARRGASRSGPRGSGTTAGSASPTSSPGAGSCSALGLRHFSWFFAWQKDWDAAGKTGARIVLVVDALERRAGRGRKNQLTRLHTRHDYRYIAAAYTYYTACVDPFAGQGPLVAGLLSQDEEFFFFEN